MRAAAFAFVAATATATVLTPLVRRAACRAGAVDHALSTRKVHARAVPRLGGIAIVVAFFAPLLLLGALNSSIGARFYSDPPRAMGLFVGGALIALLGVWDDLRGADAKLKFTVQFAVAGLMYAVGYRIDQISIPFGPTLALGPLLGCALTVVWIAGVINAVNLVDGLDGLAGGVAFIALACVFVLAAGGNRPLMMLFSAGLAGAVLGFLFYNLHPATIFMGDTGSMFLGFVLATTSISTGTESSATVSLFVPVLLLGVPIADTLLAMARRAARGVPLFSADRDHLHHRLLARGLSHRQTVLVLHATSVLLAVAAYLLGNIQGVRAVALLAAVALGAVLGLRQLGYFHLCQVQGLLVRRRRNLEVKAELRGIAARLQCASDAADLWEPVREAAPRLGAVGVELHVDEGVLAGHRFVEVPEPRGSALQRDYSLHGERPGAGTLRLVWSHAEHLHPDTDVAVEKLCRDLKSALVRLEQSAVPIGASRVELRERRSA